MPVSLEKRVAALEEQVAQMQQRQNGNPPASRAWLEDLYGKFAGDPYFAEAMKLGKQYRESLRLRRRKSKTKK